MDIRKCKICGERAPIENPEVELVKPRDFGLDAAEGELWPVHRDCFLKIQCPTPNCPDRVHHTNYALGQNEAGYFWRHKECPQKRIYS
jgi:hypothetical protein